MTISVDRPGEISSVRMLRNSTVTHLQDGDQRNVELKIVSRGAKTVTVEVPNSNYLPAGPYMLFVHRVKPEWRDRIPAVEILHRVFEPPRAPARTQQSQQGRDPALLDLVARVHEVDAALERVLGRL